MRVNEVTIRNLLGLEPIQARQVLKPFNSTFNKSSRGSMSEQGVISSRMGVNKLLWWGDELASLWHIGALSVQNIHHCTSA